MTDKELKKLKDFGDIHNHSNCGDGKISLAEWRDGMPRGTDMNCITPNLAQVMGNTDSESIQNAINEAKRTGLNKVVIPRYNERTERNIWIIDTAILLPSDIEIVLDNSHLRMADGVYSNMFRNALARTPEGLLRENEQCNIHITGIGNAVLDGGEPNGLDEYTQLKNGKPHVTSNVLIYLHNVRDFSLTGFSVHDQRYWAIELMFARFGRVKNLSFRLNRHHIDAYQPWRFQDGVDLRVGCSNILVEDIEGEIGDDLVALTALSNPNNEEAERVEGRDRDIHDIIIRNIRGISNMCSIIRILCHFGQRIYNVTIDGVYDVGRPGLDARTQMVLRIGDDCSAYYRKDFANRVKLGEMFNISVNNVFSRGLSALNISTCVKNLTARNIHVHSDGGYAVMFGYSVVGKVFIYHPSRREEYDDIRLLLRDSEMRTPDKIDDLESVPHTELENVLVENVFYDVENGYSDAVVGVWNARCKNVSVKNIFNSTNVDNVKYYDELSSKIDI